MTLGDPAEFFRGLVTMPTSLTSEELTKLDPIIRQRTFFSARVECEKFLEGVRRFVQECMAESVNESTFLDRVDRWLREHKDILGDKFPNVQERLHDWTPEEIIAYERSVRHIDSLARLRLIYRTQAEMCAGWNQYRVDMQPEQLRTWPGWEFVRRPGAKTFRKDHVEHEGDIRLKTDVDFWLARNSADQGGFELPYPPFGFNSWMWVYPVGRRKCIALGLIAEGDKVELPDELRKKYGLDEEHAMQVLKQMLDKLCKYPEEQNAPQKPADAPASPEEEPPAVVDQPQEEPPDNTPQEPQKPDYLKNVPDAVIQLAIKHKIDPYKYDGMFKLLTDLIGKAGSKAVDKAMNGQPAAKPKPAPKPQPKPQPKAEPTPAPAPTPKAKAKPAPKPAQDPQADVPPDAKNTPQWILDLAAAKNIDPAAFKSRGDLLDAVMKATMPTFESKAQRLQEEALRRDLAERVKLTGKEIDAVRYYTSTDGFSHINTEMRTMKPKDFSEQTRTMIDACRQELQEPTIVRRGTGFKQMNTFGMEIVKDHEYTENEIIDYLNTQASTGRTFKADSVLSTSVVQGAGFDKKMDMVIFCPPGTKGVYAKPFSFYAHEEEFALAFKSKMRIIHAEPRKNGEKTIVRVYVEIIP